MAYTHFNGSHLRRKDKRKKKCVWTGATQAQELALLSRGFNLLVLKLIENSCTVPEALFVGPPEELRALESLE